MRMRLKQNLWMFPAALLFGLWLSLSYINPHDGTIPLNILVCQLSGARGTFPMEINLTALLGLTLRLTPFLVFQALAGISFYRHYCTASVYIFSRMPNRLLWYAKECSILTLQTLLYQALALAIAIGCAAIRCDITQLSQGVPVLVYHLLIWSLWTLAFTLGVNLLAIYVGSSTAFAILAAIQVACISALMAVKHLSDQSPTLAASLARSNPASCLILSWQTGRNFQVMGGSLLLEGSLTRVLLAAVVVAVVGGILVQRHDLLISDTDGG